MAIITLTTDMGLKDHYVASLKGTILSHLENVNIVDVTHTIKPFDVAEAAFLLQSCYQDFPKGTVHVIGVDSDPIINFGGSDGSFPSVMILEGQYFVSNDNGFFGCFLKEKQADSFWRIDDVLSNPKLFAFPTKNMLIPIAIELIKGTSVDQLASPADSYKNAFVPSAISEPNLIKGHVIHIDSYGNAITNVSKDLFEQIGKESPFTLYFKREKKDYFIDRISNAFNEVPPGEKVAIFNEQGLIEIAINRGANRSTGGAEQLFGLSIGDMVRVEFTPRGSRDTIDSLF